MLPKESALHFDYKNPVSRISGRLVLFWWFLLISLPALFLALCSVKMQNNMIVYIALWLFIVIGLFVFICRWSFSAVLGRPFDILEIPVYLGLTSMFLIQSFGLAPYFDGKYLRLLASVSDLPRGLFLTGTGLFSMLLGYAVVRKSYKHDTVQIRPTFYNAPSLSLSFFVYIGILFLRFALIANGSGEMLLTNTVVRVGGDWYQWLEYLIELRWFFVALVTLQVFGGKWPRLFFIFIVSIESIMAVISGWSSLLPKIVLIIFSCVIYTQRKFPWRFLLPVGLIGIAVVVFSIPIARNMRFSGQITWPNIRNSFDATWGDGFENGWKLFSDMIIERQTVIAQTPSILLNLIPSTIPYLPWQDVAASPIAFIPRVIWPSKPVYTNLGSWLTVQVFGGQESSGSSAITMAGSAYIYGGWLVVVIGMFLVGVMGASIYRWLALPGLLNGQVGLLAVYASVIVANFHLGEGDFVSLWQGLIQRIVVFVVVARLLCEKPALETRRSN